MAPAATASQIENAMLNTARDLGAPGYDTTYGFGLVDVLAAAKVVAPQFFGHTRQLAARPRGAATNRIAASLQARSRPLSPTK